MDKGEILKEFEPIIHTLCLSYFYKLPHYSYFDLSDLKQECRLVISQFIHNYDEAFKASQKTFLYGLIKRRLHILVIVSELRLKKINIAEENFDFNSIQSNSRPEKTVMFLQFLEQCSNISIEFVDMILNGVPEELLLEERRLRRARLRKRNGTKRIRLDDKRESAFNTPLKFPKTLIEDYFDLKVKKIQDLYNNYIEE